MTDEELPPEIIDPPEVRALFEEWQAFDAHESTTRRQLEQARLDAAQFNVGNIVEVFYTKRWNEPRQWRVAKIISRRATTTHLNYGVRLQTTTKQWGQRAKTIVDQYVRAKKEDLEL